MANGEQGNERALFFGTLSATAVASVLLIAPSAWHRIHFRQKDKERVLLASNSLSIAGLAFLALAMVGAVMLIADFIYSPTVTIVSGVIAVAAFAWFWGILPVATRTETERK